MKAEKLFALAEDVNRDNIEEVMHQAVALELATIPTYLSTYYSINRAQDQDALFEKLVNQLSMSGRLESKEEAEKIAQELKLDILVYANKAAALTMSVVIEEMLHLALSCNVKQMVCRTPPDLVGIGKALIFPTQLDGHVPEFIINAGPLSLQQLTTFLEIESPKKFDVPKELDEKLQDAPLEYQTIGQLYEKVMACIKKDFPGPYPKRPQLLPPQPGGNPRPFYSQNSMNTVYYDREHNPHLINEDDSGELVGVYDAHTAVEALKLICEQGEGNTKKKDDESYQHLLEWDVDKYKLPKPMEVKLNEKGEAEVCFLPGDYDDKEKKELTHFAKFLEAYSLGRYYQEKFEKDYPELDDFFSYFVYNQDVNPKKADYIAAGNKKLELANDLGNAVFTYILLLVETCYYKDEDTQYELFMFGIHKSMIWLLSGVGNHINQYTYTKDSRAYRGALTFEPYDFQKSYLRPKEQILEILNELAEIDPYWTKSPGGWTDNYFPSLPDVDLDHNIIKDMPQVNSTPYRH